MKKRFLALLCMVAILMMALPLTASASTAYYVYTSNGKPLNMRSDMVTHADNRIASIPYGTKVSVQEFMESDTWAYIKYNGKYGYVMTRYLVSTKPKALSTSESTSSEVSYAKMVEANYTATVRPSAPGGFVNLRWGPSKSTPIQEKLYDGQTLEVIEQNNTWAQVRVVATGHVGFIMRSFITQAVNSGN